MRGNRFDQAISYFLITVGILCLLQAGSKALLWVGGDRATGYISTVESGVSKTGAVWTHYSFRSANKEQHSGSAMAAKSAVIALHQPIQVAYFAKFPMINMPAYGGYAAIIGIGWTVGGLILVGIALSLWKYP